MPSSKSQPSQNKTEGWIKILPLSSNSGIICNFSLAGSWGLFVYLHAYSFTEKCSVCKQLMSWCTAVLICLDFLSLLSLSLFAPEYTVSEEAVIVM